MGLRWRWAVAATVTAGLVGLPFAAHLLPGGDSTVSAPDLLARINSSAPVAYTGYAESSGGLGLPSAASDFSDVEDLFGGTSRLRVWWRTAQDWRIDSIGLTGETDIHRDSTGLWTWDYESNLARRTQSVRVPLVRLPRSEDLVPANLARRLLSEVDTADISRLPGVRVAGHETAGLRVHISDRRSTIEHIDVWALPGNGLPVRVQVFGAESAPVISTSFLDLSVTTPAAATTAFEGARGERLEGRQFSDIVSAIDRLDTDNAPPRTLVGLPRRTDLELGSVGVYGRGVTILVAVPLSARFAGEFVPQLRRTPGVVEDSSGISVTSGPLSLQVSPPAGFGARWLLVGTLQPSALVAAVNALPSVQGFGIGRP